MNSNLKPILKLVTIAVLLISIKSNADSTSSTDENSENTHLPFCNQEITQSIGLMGYKYPKKMFLDMCPLVKQSCCRLEDQLAIYKTWVNAKEEEGLEERFAYHMKIYMELLKKTKEVYARAKSTFELVEDRAVSNCKILARRIINYRVDILMPVLKTQIEYMHSFLLDSYKGLYCTICDATQTKYIKIKTKEFIYSEEYCRGIINNTLVVLLYFHHHFNKYLNLISKFVTQCDYVGNFKLKPLSQNLVFHSKGSHYKMLHGCNQYRNNINWFDFCEPVCKQFSLAEFKDFFKPNLDKIRKYTRWLGKEVVKINSGEARDIMIKGQRKNIKAAKARKIQQMKDKGEDVSALIDPNRSRMLSSASGSNTSSSNSSNSSNNTNNQNNNDGTNDDEFDEETKKEKDDIMLEEQQKFEEHLSDALMPLETREVFRTVQNSQIPYVDFKSMFELDGLNPLPVGKVSQFTENLYNSIQKAVDLESKGFFGGSNDDDEDWAGIHVISVVSIFMWLFR